MRFHNCFGENLKTFTSTINSYSAENLGLKNPCCGLVILIKL